MHRLKNEFQGERAVIIFGGPSIIENHLDLSLLDKHRYAIFLESKALTPYFLDFGIEPHFFLMFYPEKCKSNSFQMVIFQSFLANIDLRPLIRDDLRPELDHMKNHFDDYFEVWKPKMPHKRYRWKPDVYLKNSPFDLLSKLKHTSLITYVAPFRQYVTRFEFDNPLYMYDHELATGSFSLDAYYRPVVDDGCLKVADSRFTNSAAIALYPILNYLGFSKVYFIGMDMSMLGSMEYASLYTFKSLHHFGLFFERARPVFSASFPRSRRRELWTELREQVRTERPSSLLRSDTWSLLWRLLRDTEPRFMRPRYEFQNLRQVLSYDKIEFVNVYEPFEYARPLEGIRNISFEEFLNE